jgi:hypothetical protein
MIVSRRHRFIFLKTRKTGGTSIELALSRFLGPEDVATRIDPVDEAARASLGVFPRNESPPGLVPWLKRSVGRGQRFYNHMAATELRRFLSKLEWEGYFKFAVERSPWDLCVSAHAWDEQQRKKRGLPPRSFDAFLFSEDVRLYSNWAIYAEGERILVDRVLRYEDLDSQFNEVARCLDIEVGPLPHAKSGIRTDFRRPSEIYGPRARERVEEVFCHELRHFRWEWGELSTPTQANEELLTVGLEGTSANLSPETGCVKQ